MIPTFHDASFRRRRSVASSSTCGESMKFAVVAGGAPFKGHVPLGQNGRANSSTAAGRRIFLGLGNSRRTVSILISTTAVLNSERTRLAKVRPAVRSINVVGALNVWARGILAGRYSHGTSEDRDLALARHPSQASPRAPQFLRLVGTRMMGSSSIG